MAERVIRVSGYVICQLLLALLIPFAMVISLFNRLLLKLQQELQRAAEQPVHIHYEVHQHVHIEAPTAYQRTLDDVSRHLPVPLRRVEALPRASVQYIEQQRPTQSLPMRQVVDLSQRRAG